MNAVQNGGYIAQNCGAVMARPTSGAAGARNPLNTCLFARNLHRNSWNRNATGPAISCGHGRSRRVGSILDVRGIDDGRDLVAADRERDSAVYFGLQATLYAGLPRQSCPSRRPQRAAEMGGKRA